MTTMEKPLDIESTSSTNPRTGDTLELLIMKESDSDDVGSASETVT